MKLIGEPLWKKEFAFLAIFMLIVSMWVVNSERVDVIDGENDNIISPELGKIEETYVGEHFTLNKGQISDPEVIFHSQNAYFTSQGVIFRVIEVVEPQEKDTFDPLEQNILQPRMQIIKMNFQGANNVNPIGLNKVDHVSNFFLGNEPMKWRTEVPSFNEIYYQNIYPGIDFRFYSNRDGLKYDFIVHPGAEPNRIRIGYEGIEKLELDEHGNMIIRTMVMDMIDSGLFIYQDIDGIRQSIEGKFSILDKKNYGFKIIDEYNHNKDLVIDPYLIYSTFIGGSSDEFYSDIAIDPNGNAFIVMQTKSIDFPTTPGVLDTILNGTHDLTLTKFNADGSKVLYSTYIGGSKEETPYGCTIDSSGNAFLTGYTDSWDFPTTQGAYDTSYNSSGLEDVFVLKINHNGSKLLYSTWLEKDVPPTR